MAEPTNQKQRVLAVMRDGEWRPLWTIRAEILKRYQKLDTEAAISARLRELRRDGFPVMTQKRGRGQLFEYQVVCR